MNLLPDDDHFDEFLDLFDTVDWTTKSDLIRSKLKDDERYRDHLKTAPPGDDMIDWVRSQMVLFVQVLKGEVRVKGSQQDLDVAIRDSKKILAYLWSCDDPIAKEDLLLKLAIDAGYYCASGIRRTTTEIVFETVVPNYVPADDPQAVYEIKVRHALQTERRRIVESHFSHSLDLLPDSIAKNQHTFDRYHAYFKLGFYPIDREKLSLLTVGYWELFNRSFLAMRDEYVVSLGEVISMQECIDYLWGRLGQNESLSETQVQQIMHSWGEPRTDWDFTKLLFIMLGVLKVK